MLFRSVGDQIGASVGVQTNLATVTDLGDDQVGACITDGEIETRGQRTRPPAWPHGDEPSRTGVDAGARSEAADRDLSEVLALGMLALELEQLDDEHRPLCIGSLRSVQTGS